MNSAFHTTKYLANNVTTSPNKRKREQIENTTPSAASTALTSFKNIFRKKGKNENEQEKENDENMTNQTFAIPENFSNKKRKLQDESEIKPKPDSNCSPSDYKLPLPDFITSSPVSTNTPNTRYSKRKQRENENSTPIQLQSPKETTINIIESATPTNTPRGSSTPRILSALSSFHSQTPTNVNNKPKILETIFSPVFNFFQKKEEENKTKSQFLAPDEDLPLDTFYNTFQNTNSDEVSWNYTVTEESESLSSLFEEEEETVNFPFQYDSLLFMKYLPPLEDEMRNRKPHLPPRAKGDNRLTLVLDLDETLVHCSTQYLSNADYTFPVLFGGVEYTVHARKRPYLYEFLSYVKKLFEVVIFTASQKVYADCILDLIEEKEKYVDHRLYRDSCVFSSGNYLKDLSILGRDLSNVVLIDNSITVFGFQINNGIPITSWYEDHQDEELLTLLPFLESLTNGGDVRLAVEKRYRLAECIRNVSQDDIISEDEEEDDLYE